MITHTFTHDGRTFRCWTEDAADRAAAPASASWHYETGGERYDAFRARDDDLATPESRGAFERAIVEWHRAHVEHGPDDDGRPVHRWILEQERLRELADDEGVTMEFAPLFIPRAKTDNVVYLPRPLTEEKMTLADRRLA